MKSSLSLSDSVNFLISVPEMQKKVLFCHHTAAHKDISPCVFQSCFNRGSDSVQPSSVTSCECPAACEILLLRALSCCTKHSSLTLGSDYPFPCIIPDNSGLKLKQKNKTVLGAFVLMYLHHHCPLGESRFTIFFFSCPIMGLCASSSF